MARQAEGNMRLVSEYGKLSFAARDGWKIVLSPAGRQLIDQMTIEPDDHAYTLAFFEALRRDNAVSCIHIRRYWLDEVGMSPTVDEWSSAVKKACRMLRLG